MNRNVAILFGVVIPDGGLIAEDITVDTTPLAQYAERAPASQCLPSSLTPASKWTRLTVKTASQSICAATIKPPPGRFSTLRTLTFEVASIDARRHQARRAHRNWS